MGREVGWSSIGITPARPVPATRRRPLGDPHRDPAPALELPAQDGRAPGDAATFDDEAGAERPRSDLVETIGELHGLIVRLSAQARYGRQLSDECP